MGRRASIFGQGVYDLLTASHLLGISERTLRLWSQPAPNGAAPLCPATHGWAFSFHDLLSLAVIAVLRQRKVTTAGVRETIRQLEARFEYERPLAHQNVVDGIATVGKSVVLLGEETDLTRSGQGVLLDTVRTYLLPVEYGTDSLARLWRPADFVLVDPDVQVGHPCIDSTRITTDTISGRAAQGESIDVIADDLGLTVEEVEAAIAFESRLDDGIGLARVA